MYNYHTGEKDLLGRTVLNSQAWVDEYEDQAVSTINSWQVWDSSALHILEVVELGEAWISTFSSSQY